MTELKSLENLTERRGEGSVMLVGVTGRVVRVVSLERSTLGVVVRGGGGGVVRGRPGLQAEAVLLAHVGIVLVL